ncbi:MAG: DUF1223 domain-containing protein [Acidobacteria bacterium]|nr:DUF1223 domain-containing protein [Acidobacteriota bacterium]
MKKLIILFLAFILSACVSQTVESQKLPETPAAQSTVSPVIVELFTSEGCSSCPAAERALEFLRREQPVPNAEIITLALHVDYWDRSGWKDEFSSPLFTQRQEFYASRFKLDSAYTPQMVIDGRFEVVGSDTGRATRLIQDAAKHPKAAIEAKFVGNELNINIDSIPKHEDATVFVAVVEDEITREISGGENRGRTLKHASVVRELRAIGPVRSDTSTVAISDRIGFQSRLETRFSPLGGFHTGKCVEKDHRRGDVRILSRNVCSAIRA